MQGTSEIQFIDFQILIKKIGDFFGGKGGDRVLFEGGGLLGVLDSPVVRVISALLILIALVGIFYTLIRLREFYKDDARRFQEYFIKPSVKKRKNERWEKITALFGSQTPSDWRVAIIEADSMLEELFTRLGYPGDTLGEKMKAATSRDFPSIQRAWDAHLVRNRIAHDGMNYNLEKNEVNRVFHNYEAVFRDAQFI